MTIYGLFPFWSVVAGGFIGFCWGWLIHTLYTQWKEKELRINHFTHTNYFRPKCIECYYRMSKVADRFEREYDVEQALKTLNMEEE